MSALGGRSEARVPRWRPPRGFRLPCRRLARFAVAGSPARTALRGQVALGLAWSTAFAGLIISRIRTSTRSGHRAE